ncbi:MAG: PilN domain-containing protein [Zoogloeaceae bacterium]|nr:PilN domain-containing protein [Zoogloeaceae bacterium]
MLTTQQEANQRLETEIGESKKLIEEIKTVREQSNALLGRKNAIEGLQKNRGDIVHLLNELVARIPSGIYLTSLRQNGSRISVNGYAQSNSRVSELMRNIVASPWMGDPRLLEIKASAVGGRRQNSFSLEFSLIEADPQVVAKAEAALAEAPPDDEMLVAPPTEVSSAGESAAETPPASASSTEGVAQ